MTPFTPVEAPLTKQARWLFASLILVGANLRAPITSLGPVLGNIQGDLHLGGTLAGALNALPLLVFAVLSLVAPSLGRKHGLERVLGIAVAAIATGTLVRSLPAPGFIWIGTLLLSAGIAFGNVLLPGLVKRDFPRRAPALIGMYAAAMAGMAGLAAGLAAPIASLPHSSWRWSIGVWAALALITLVAWLPHFKRPQRHQQAMQPAPKVQSRPSPWRHALGWQVSIFFATHSLVFYALVDWYATYAASKGISTASAGVHLLVYQIVAVATNLGSVSLIKRLPDQRLLGFACGTTLVIGTGGLLLAPSLALLWLVFAGLGAGVAMVTSLSLFALRTHDHHQAASLSGMAQFVGYLGAAAGPLMVGVLHDMAGNWTLPLTFLIAVSVLVMVSATLAGRHRRID